MASHFPEMGNFFLPLCPPGRAPVRCLPHMAFISFESYLPAPLGVCFYNYLFDFQKIFWYNIKKNQKFSAALSFLSIPVRMSVRGKTHSSHLCYGVFTKADFYQPSYPKGSSHEFLSTEKFSWLYEPKFDFYKNF